MDTKQMTQERLWKAAETGDSKTIRMLAMGDAAVDIDARNPEGFTAFNLATAGGHADAAMTILAIRELRYAQTIGVDPAEFFKLKPGATAIKPRREKAVKQSA